LAVTRAGRHKVIIAGTGFEVCAELPALACAAGDYDAYVAVDACGLFASAPSVAAISRLTQAGVALADTRVVVLEAMADNAHPMASEIYATLPAGLVPADAALGAQRTAHHAGGQHQGWRRDLPEFCRPSSWSARARLCQPLNRT
jgi:Isochorismatase family